MSRVFIVLIILFFGGGTILVVQAMKTNTARVFTPSELAAKAESFHVPRARVVGMVAPEKLIYETEPTIKLSFQIRDPEGTAEERIAVHYDKLMPDMFAPGRSVIIDGAFRDGTLYATHLMTQCPSKYEPPTPTKTDAAPASTESNIS
ncbi:cytochrome c maturation protein CcmE [bacterium]|nr:cytochrome c maturation protein CcmE [bacterium]